jgi:5-methylcytosine-specific restriction endonuclease McrA
MKTCSQCQRTLDLTAFNRQNSRPDGRRSYCRECQREKMRMYRIANPNLDRNYYRVNRDRVLEQAMRYYEAHRDEQIQRGYRWRIANRERWLQIKIASEGRRRARKRATQEIPVDLRVVLDQCGRWCYLCGEVIGDDLSFDHVMPLSRGGTHTYENIRPTHLICNMRKSNKTGDLS